MQNSNTQSAIELLMTQPTLLENLRKAYMGNYGVILSLLVCLDQGLHAKKLVDRVIDASMLFSLFFAFLHVSVDRQSLILAADQVTNLREDILIYRLKYSLTTMDEAKGEDFLNKATKSLEK